MDIKKVALIGGALLLGGTFLFSRQPSVKNGGGAAGGLGGLIIEQLPTKKEEIAAAGGDVYTTYNITFPETAGITFPEPSFLGGGAVPTQLTETKKDAAAKEISDDFKTLFEAQKLRVEHAPGWGVFAPTLGGAKGLIAFQERVAATKKETAVAEEPKWKSEGIKMPFGLPTLYPSKPMGAVR